MYRITGIHHLFFFLLCSVQVQISLFQFTPAAHSVSSLPPKHFPRPPSASASQSSNSLPCSLTGCFLCILFRMGNTITELVTAFIIWTANMNHTCWLWNINIPFLCDHVHFIKDMAKIVKVFFSTNIIFYKYNI